MRRRREQNKRKEIFLKSKFKRDPEAGKGRRGEGRGWSRSQGDRAAGRACQKGVTTQNEGLDRWVVGQLDDNKN